MIRSRSRSVSVCHSPWHPRGYRSLKFADLFQIIYVIRNKFFTIRSFIAVAYLVIDLNANRTFQLAQFKFRFRIVCTSRLWYYLPIYQAQITSIKLYKMPSSLSLSLFDLSTLIIVVSTLFQINIIVVYCLFSRFSISFLWHPLLSFSLRLLFVFMTRSL